MCLLLLLLLANGWFILQARSEVEAQEVSGLARAMLAAHEHVGRMYSSVTASAGLGTGDWRVRCLMGDNSYYNDAQNWSFGSAGEELGGHTGGQGEFCLFFGWFAHRWPQSHEVAMGWRGRKAW
jgi:hypothetical protein